MGGNLLQGVERKDAESYRIIKHEVLARFHDEGSVQCCVPPELPHKQSFGDLDVLYSYHSNCAEIEAEHDNSDNNNCRIPMHSLVVKLFNATQIVKVGNVLSFEYKQFQIDMIYSQQKYYDCARFFLAYSDLGGLIGTMANWYRLKFGHKGLWLNLSKENAEKFGLENYIGREPRIDLTHSPDQICHFFGMDFQKFQDGFDDELQIFQFLCQATKFDMNMFRVSSLTTDNKKREHTRPFFGRFLNYLNEQRGPQIDNSSYSYSEDECRDLQLEAIEHFNKCNDVVTVLTNIQLSQRRKAKFNGRILLECGVQPNLIGHVTSRFLSQYQNFDEFLDNTEATEVKNTFMKWYQELQM